MTAWLWEVRPAGAEAYHGVLTFSREAPTTNGRRRRGKDAEEEGATFPPEDSQLHSLLMDVASLDNSFTSYKVGSGECILQVLGNIVVRTVHCLLNTTLF